LEKTTQSWALSSVLLTKYYSGDQIKKNELGGARGTYVWVAEGMHLGLLSET